MPIDSDEWIAFDKVDTGIEAKIMCDLLKTSTRFKNAESITAFLMQRYEGVDAVINSEIQVSGGWSASEQIAMRDRVRKAREFHPTGPRIQVRERARNKAMLHMIEELFQDAIDNYAAWAKEVGDKFVPSRRIPEKIAISIVNGETRLEKILESKRAMYAIRWPGVGNRVAKIYKPRYEQLALDEKLTNGSLLCVMIELWDNAPAEAKKLAAERADQNGAKVGRRPV